MQLMNHVERAIHQPGEELLGNRHETSSGRGFLGEAPTASGGCRLYWCFKDVKVDVSISSTTKHWLTQLPARRKKKNSSEALLKTNSCRFGLRTKTSQNAEKNFTPSIFPTSNATRSFIQLIGNHHLLWTAASKNCSARSSQVGGKILSFHGSFFSNEGHRGDPNNKSKEKKRWMLHLKSFYTFPVSILKMLFF